MLHEHQKWHCMACRQDCMHKACIHLRLCRRPGFFAAGLEQDLSSRALHAHAHSTACCMFIAHDMKNSPCIIGMHPGMRRGSQPRVPENAGIGGLLEVSQQVGGFWAPTSAGVRKQCWGHLTRRTRPGNEPGAGAFRPGSGAPPCAPPKTPHTPTAKIESDLGKRVVGRCGAMRGDAGRD